MATDSEPESLCGAVVVCCGVESPRAARGPIITSERGGQRYYCQRITKSDESHQLELSFRGACRRVGDV